MPSNVKSKGGARTKTKHKKRTKSSREQSIDGSEGNLELDRELYPIGHYLSDRTEMVKQMFGILSKDKIQSMLPPVLKEIQWSELKALCLEQLNSMSEKNIIKILAGKPYAPDLEDDECDKNQHVGVASSSSSSTSSCGESSQSSTSSSDNESEAEVKDSSNNHVTIKPDPGKLDDDPDMLQIGLSPKEMGDLLEEDEGLERKDKDNAGAMKMIVGDDGNGRNVLEKKSENKEAKTLLEILELEMRARAIRALLKQSTVPCAKDKTKPECASSKKEARENKSEKSTHLSVNMSVKAASPVAVKEEVVSEEEDVVFVSESQTDKASPKERKKPQKECLSAVYNVSADILKFKPTVLSTTSKVSVVDTAGNPITLPKVKPQNKEKMYDSSVIVIDNELPGNGSSDPKPVKLKINEVGHLKRKAGSDIDILTYDTDNANHLNLSKTNTKKQSPTKSKDSERGSKISLQSSHNEVVSTTEEINKNGKKVLIVPGSTDS